MALTRRMFAQLVASALLLRHLPALAQTPLTVAVGGTPYEYNPTRGQRGAPADMLLLAVAPEKLVGLSSFDLSRQTAIPFHDDIRALPKLGRLAGRASTLSLEALLALKPDPLLTAAMPMKPAFRPDR